MCTLSRTDLTVRTIPPPGERIESVRVERSRSARWFAANRRVHHLERADTALRAVFREHCDIGWSNDLMANAHAAGWRVQMPQRP